MTATIAVTREDAQTLWAAASALRHAESRHRCEHLAPKVAQLSERDQSRCAGRGAGGGGVVKITLPMPPSNHRHTGQNHLALHKRKNTYRREAWFAAVRAVRPPFDPPSRVRVEAVLYVHNEFDDDNAAAMLKWPLDTLKQKQRGKIDWRSGLYDRCGYLVDDAPKHCEVAPPRQVVDRSNPRIELTLTPLEPS